MSEWLDTNLSAAVSTPSIILFASDVTGPSTLVHFSLGVCDIDILLVLLQATRDAAAPAAHDTAIWLVLVNCSTCDTDA
jgi:hypothetical protein